MKVKKIISLLITLYFLLFTFLYPISTVKAQQQVRRPFVSSRLYIPLSSHITAVKSGDNTDLIVKDYLSSTKVIVGKNGNSADTFAYYPYGDLLETQSAKRAVQSAKRVTQDSKPTTQTDHLFTGHRKLDNSKVYHAGARFLSPQLGLFVQPDRVEGPNRYVYARNNPIFFTDPSGNFAFLAAFAIVGFAAFLATTPIKDSPSYPNPEFNQNAAQWAATGGPEFSMNMLRFNPIVGIPAASAELVTGRNIVNGEDLSARAQAFNVMDLATLGFGAADNVVGSYNRGAQRARLSRYQYGEDLLNTSSVEEAETVIRRASPETIFGFDEAAEGAAYYQDAGKAGPEIMYRSKGARVLSTAQHEGVHALQYANELEGVASPLNGRYTLTQLIKREMLRPAVNPRVTINRMRYNLGLVSKSSFRNQVTALFNPMRKLDLEMMAYASTKSRGTTFTSQLGGAMWSTGSKGSMLRNSGTVVTGGAYLPGLIYGGNRINDAIINP